MLPRSVAAIVVAASLGAACAGDAEHDVATSPSIRSALPSYVGTYALFEVSGQPLPILQAIDAAGQTEFTGGQIALLPGDRWTVASYFRSTLLETGRSWVDTATGGGTYHAAGATLVLTESGATSPVATITMSGTDIALAFADARRAVWRYRRTATAP